MKQGRPRTKWLLPTCQDGNAFMLRATKAEEHLVFTLNMLEKAQEFIPYNPDQTIKKEIHDFLQKYKP